MSVSALKNLLGGRRNSNADKARRRTRKREGLSRSVRLESLEERRLLTATLVNFLTHEHVDINLTHSGTEWSIGPRNSDASPAIQYANDQAMLYAGSPAEVNRPADASYDFIGVGSGEGFYLLPQTQDTDLLYLGIAGYGLDTRLDRYNPSAESKGRVSGSARWAKVALADVRHFNPDGTVGDGDFSLWQSGIFGSANVFMSSYDDGIANPNANGLDTTDGVSSDDAMWVIAGGHSHFNFGFTDPGRYEIDVKLSAYFGSDGNDSTPNTAGFDESTEITLYFSVASVGQLQLEQASYSFSEDVGTATVDVVRVGGSDGRITVNYTTSNGSATAGADFTTVNGTLEFLDGETRKSIAIPISDDTVEEADETYTIALTAPAPDNIHRYLIDVENDVNGLLGEVTSATVTILGNDQPRLNRSPVANDDSYTVTEDGSLSVGAAGVLVNDTDADGDSLTAALVEGPQNGSVTLHPDGSFSYIPNPNFSGTDTFTYTTTDVRYQITPLGTLGGNHSYALDVNNHRQVTGNSSTNSNASFPLQAYRWENGAMTGLGVLAGTGSNNFSRGYAINDGGMVVGESDNDASMAFVYRDGMMMGLTRLAGDNFRGAAHDINNAGTIVGISSNGTVSRPTIWTWNGTAYVAADLGTIAGTSTSTGRAWAINEAGAAAGLSHNADGTSQATLWSSGVVTNLGSLGDGTRFSQAYGLNDNGLVVGSSSTGQTVGQLIGTTSSTGITRAFVWHDGHMHELLPANFYNATNTGPTANYHSVASDVNDAGVIVGNSQRISGWAANATLWVDEAALDINSLISAGSGWSLRSAEGINDNGDIIGFGSFDGFSRAFLLTPVFADNDGEFFGNVATVTINVTPQPDDPIAVDDNYEVKPGEFVRGNVLLNDIEPDGEAITATITSPPTAGSLTMAANGSFLYTPGASFAGSDSFSYQIQDVTGAMATATVNLSAAQPRQFGTTLTTEHVDIGVAFGAGEHSHDHDGHSHSVSGELEWDLHIHDETNDQEYEPDEALLYVGMDALTTRSGPAADPAFDFLGVAPGGTFFMLPEINNPSLLHLGIGGEELAVGVLHDTVTLRLAAVSGPGEFSVWQSGGQSPVVKMASSNGIDAADAIEVAAGRHAHMNFAFTEAGFYGITFVAQGIGTDGHPVESEPVTYFFRVGGENPLHQPPSPTAANAATGNPPTISWPASPRAESYDIWLVNLDTGALAASARGLTSTSYEVGSTLTNGRYRVFIRAWNSFGTSGFGAPFDFSVGAPVTAPAPTSANSAVGNPPTISWPASPRAETYDIWLVNLDTGALATSARGLTGTSFEVGSTLPNGSYRVFVRAWNSAGTSGFGAPFDFSVGTPATAPAPTSANSAVGNPPTISWPESPGARTYEIYLVNMDTGMMAASVRGLTDTAYTHSSELPNAKYRVFVRAWNQAGNSGFGVPYDFNIGAPVTTPAVPSNLTAINTHTPRPTLQWDAVPGATSYSVWFVNLDSGALVASSPYQAASSYAPTGDLATGRYGYYVKANNSAGSSAFSSRYDFAVAAPAAAWRLATTEDAETGVAPQPALLADRIDHSFGTATRASQGTAWLVDEKTRDPAQQLEEALAEQYPEAEPDVVDAALLSL